MKIINSELSLLFKFLSLQNNSSKILIPKCLWLLTSCQIIHYQPKKKKKTPENSLYPEATERKFLNACVFKVTHIKLTLTRFYIFSVLTILNIQDLFHIDQMHSMRVLRLKLISHRKYGNQTKIYQIIHFNRIRSTLTNSVCLIKNWFKCSSNLLTR